MKTYYLYYYYCYYYYYYIEIFKDAGNILKCLS